MKKITFACVLAALTTAGGCVLEPAFDPLGGNVGLEGTFTVEGAAPTATLCDEAGIATVELRLYEPSGSEFYADSSQRVPCSAGQITTTAQFLPGSYRVQWVAYGTSGGEVHRSSFESVTANDGDIIVSTADFPKIAAGTFNPRGTSVTLMGEWLINGATPTVTSCTDAGIASVQVLFYNGEGDDTYTDADFTFQCSEGGFVRPNSLAAGAYQSQWRALDGAGNVIAEDEVLPLVVSPGDATLATPDFVVEFSPSLNMTFGWEGTAGFQTCTEAMTSTFDYVLRDSAGTDVSSMTGIGCTETLNFSDLAPGTYSLDVAGYYADGALGWQAICTPLEVTDGVAAYDCDIAGVTPTLVTDIGWQVAAGGAYGTCAEASIMAFSYWLRDGFGASVSEMFGIACTEQLSFEDLAPGEYTLELDGTRTDGRKLAGNCDMLVTSLGIEEYNCFADIT